jgi:hypothetical protein
MTKLRAVPQKTETKQVKTISGKAPNPLLCKKLARSVMKRSQYHKLVITSKDGTEAVIGGTLFVRKDVGELPKKVTLMLTV